MNHTHISRKYDGESPSIWEQILTKIQRPGLQFKFSGSFSNDCKVNIALLLSIHDAKVKSDCD